ncbi:MAG: twin-arginine translocase TatA/TatE family subunit [Sphingomonadaceae bacterium]
MGGLSLAHWAVVALIAILLLGGGRFSKMATDVAKGLKGFKRELGEKDEAERIEN